MIYQFETNWDITRCRQCPCHRHDKESIKCNVTDRDTTFYQRNNRKPSWCRLKKVEVQNE